MKLCIGKNPENCTSERVNFYVCNDNKRNLSKYGKQCFDLKLKGQTKKQDYKTPVTPVGKFVSNRSKC